MNGSNEKHTTYLLVLSIDVGATAQQQPNQLDLALVGRRMEARLKFCLSLRAGADWLGWLTCGGVPLATAVRRWLLA